MRINLTGIISAAPGLVLAALLLGGCAAPISARRVGPRQVYAQVEANAIRMGETSADTAVILHRYNLDRLAHSRPDEAVRQLHEKALATGERDLLFALAELSYVAAEHIGRSVKPWDLRDARDYYLGSAVYSWLFLFGDCKAQAPGAFDRRFRRACDLYNCSLGRALIEKKGTNGLVKVASARRRLPVGELQLNLGSGTFSTPVEEFEQILLADEFRVDGLSVRNREPGLGAPLICVRPMNAVFGLHPCTPATALLRCPVSLAGLSSGTSVGSLELYSAFSEPAIAVAGARVPLEIDLTAYRAYMLNQSRIWKLGRLGFLAPAERIPSQLMLNQPYEPGRIPIVLVHGTFSSPVTWAELANSLISDPVVRQRYQIWSFSYGSGNPLVKSVADFRDALATQVKLLDPEGTNAALRQIVVIGHSQGGLLTKGTAIDAGDRLWRLISTNRVEDLDVSEAQRDEFRQKVFLKPLPFVKRVVFIATPHRGSYLAGGFARRWAQRLVSLPGALMVRGKDVMKFAAGSETERFLKGRTPTSLDGMSPKNPALLAMAEIPVVPEIKAHSIIPVQGGGDYHHGKDGVVSYESAHVDYVESERVVRSKHSCLNNPATIEEVRRILHEHLEGKKE